MSLAGLAETLQPGRSYILRHCPASLNFLGFSEERLDRESALDVVSRFVSLQVQSYDVVLVESEPDNPLRITGWDHLVQDGGDLSEPEV